MYHSSNLYRWTFIIAGIRFAILLAAVFNFTKYITLTALCGTTGILVTYLFVPDMTGIDLADEDRKFVEYLADNGWTGPVGEQKIDSEEKA